MTSPLGDRPLHLLDGDAASALVADLEAAHARARGLTPASIAELVVAVPPATAAFSRRDRLNAGYPAAAEAVAAHGFAPHLRPVGGRLAVYDEGSLVLHLLSGHDQPRLHIQERFSLLGEALAEALVGLGVDARVGRVPGEYCEGEFSVNDSGRSKLVGTGQRITRGGFLFSAVIMVHGADRARAALEAAYPLMGLDLRPETVGCVADAVPGVTLDEVRDAVLVAIGRLR